MNLSKLLPIFFLLIFAACNSNQNQEPTEAEDATEMTQTETLERNEGTRNWNEAWNNNDLQALQDMTADDAVLLLTSEVLTGDGITTWFETNAPVMQNLETSAEMSNEGENMAYEAGTYTHGVQGMDEEFSGVYTIVWERTDGEWKIKVMDMTQRDAQASMSETES